MIHRLKSGRLITAEEWQQWRRNGMSTEEMAGLLGITNSMARIISRKFRESGLDDPLYRKKRAGSLETIDPATDRGAYVLGVLWGTMGESEEGYLVRHRDRWYTDVVRDSLDLATLPQAAEARIGAQFRLKIVAEQDKKRIEHLLFPHGWQPRKAKERPYPSGSLNDRGFCRAWVELHSSIGIAQAKNRNGSHYPQKRLRIYGNWALMEEMNYILSAAAGLEPRTLQRTTNEITKCLLYQGKAVEPVAEWLYAGAEIWNPAARTKLEFQE